MNTLIIYNLFKAILITCIINKFRWRMCINKQNEKMRTLSVFCQNISFYWKIQLIDYMVVFNLNEVSISCLLFLFFT